MQIYKSRFTPNATGDEIKLEIGEQVLYKNYKGIIKNVVIKSGRMQHDECLNLGYEALFLDDNKMYFIDGKRIVWWDGKTTE